MKKTLFLCVGSVVSFWMASCAGTNREVSAEPQPTEEAQDNKEPPEDPEIVASKARTLETRKMRQSRFYVWGDNISATLQGLKTARGSSGVTRIFAWESWCNPCHEIAPFMESKGDLLTTPKDNEGYAIFLSVEGISKSTLAKYGYKLKSDNVPMLLVFRGATLEEEIHGSDDIKGYINGL